MKQKIPFFSILFFCLPMLLVAQKGSVSGYITDSLNVPVSYATVAVFDLRDSSIVNFGLSDDGGGFELKSLPPGIPLRLLVSHVLYHPSVKNFRLDSAENKKLDTLMVSAKDNQLTETVITWEAPPIVVRNDTIEFNADAFIGRPGSAVEELLKRIPGVEIGEDGQITYNGRNVSKITIDSKQFFGDDPVILMKNIPAKAIQKVQITEEKDERGRATETGDVSINLTLKHWAKKSHFGKAYAGYGTDQRYESGVMWNFLRDTLQISLVGYGNNLSQSGFSYSELYRMGGYNRSGVNYISFSDNSMSINGASFGGGKGITESGGGGFNLNYDIPRKWSVSTSYFLGLSRTSYEQVRNSQRNFGDTILSTGTINTEFANNNSHSFNAKFRWTPDTINMFTWRPNLAINGGKEDNELQNNNSYSYLASQTLIGNQLDNTINGIDAGSNFNWDMSLKKWEYEVFSEQIYKDESGLGVNRIRIESFTDTATYSESNYQERELESKGMVFNNYAVIRYKVNDSLSFRFSPSINHTNAFKRVMVYEQDSTLSEDVLLPGLSTRFQEKRSSYSAKFSLSKRVGKSRFYAGMSVHHADLELDNELSQSSVDRIFSYPELNLSYTRRSPTSYMDIDYSYSMELPNSTQLIDLVDNSDPNSIRTGNPCLNPEKYHELSTWARMGNSAGTHSLQWNARASVTRNGIINENFFDESGRSVTRPVNLAPHELKTYIGTGFNFTFSKESSKKWKHTPGLHVWGNMSQSWQYLNFSSYPFVSYNLSPGISYGIIKKDYFDARVSYRPSFSNSQTLGLSGPIINRYVSLSAELWWAPFEKYWIEAKGTHTRQTSSNPGVDPREFTLVNVAFTRLILKDNRGQLRLSVFDLLNQNRAISQYATGNYVETSISNAVTRYVMLSFVYNYNSFQKKGRQQRGFSFW
ncbi:MAG TPA: hypothetical protein DIW47_05215 [Bacteroidetes bacterium]|nr:hypothetical protein [Bacteroidota bacterium]